MTPIPVPVSIAVTTMTTIKIVPVPNAAEESGVVIIREPVANTIARVVIAALHLDDKTPYPKSTLIVNTTSNKISNAFIILPPQFC